MANNLIYQNQNIQQHNNDDIILIQGVKYQKFQPPIGQGSEGIVYKGQNVQTKEIIAIKENNQTNQRVYQALQAIKQNNCSHIIGIKGLQLNQNQCLTTVMEYAHGGFFDFMIKEEYKKLTYQEKNSFFIQMLEGVEQLHQLGLFHRDLKPENFVYIDDQNNNKTIKLIDFGLIKETSNQFRKTIKIGTPFYMAPEVLGSQGGFYDKSVDIWSLGAIWYEVLICQTFFKGNVDIVTQIQNITQEQINQQIQQTPQIQQNEKNFIKKMLCKDPKSRIQLKEILAAYKQNGEQQNMQQNNRQNFIINYNLPQINNYGNGFYQGGQSKLRVGNQLINKNVVQQDQEQINEMKRELERQIEQELKEKYEKLQDECRKEVENQIKIKENELKEQQEKAQQQQYEKDIQQINQMKIQQEVQLQNDMDNFIKQKEDEYKNQMEKLKQEIQKEKEQKIEQQLKELEENLKIQIENKYLLEYNQKITQMEQKQQLQYQQQLEAKRQVLFILLQSQKETIQTFIYQLKEQLKILKDFNLNDNSQFQLISQINNEIQKHNQKITFIEQKEQEIEQVQSLDILQEYDIKLVKEHNKSITEQFQVINKITEQINDLEKQLRSIQQIQQQRQEKEQQLKKLKETFSKQFQLLQQQTQSFSLNIEIIQQKISFYQDIQFDFERKNKTQDAIRLYEKITQDLQILKQKEIDIVQFEQSQQIIQYQYFICKLEELQYTQIQLQNNIQEANQFIEQINIKFIEKHQRLIDNLQEQLNDYQDKFMYLSKYQKYEQKINQILSQTEITINQINDLNQILNNEIFQNYQLFPQTYDQIQQQLQGFEKQHNQLNEQIQHDQQIDQRNAQRIKTLETTQEQLKHYIDRLNNLKQDLNNLINNQDYINQQTKNLIKQKSDYIEQNILEKQQQFLIFKQFNQLNSYETINTQINQLEQFKKKLKQQLVDEKEKLTKVQFLIQTAFIEEKSIQEKELFRLNNQLQFKNMQFTKTIQSIKIACESSELFNKINQKIVQLQLIQKEQKETLEKNLKTYQQNKTLFENKLNQIRLKKMYFKASIQKLLQKLQYISEKAGKELELLFNSVNTKCKQIKFINLDNKIIQTYEYLLEQDKLLQQQIISINQRISYQQQNPSELNQLKVEIQNLIYLLNALEIKIPQNNKIEEFNNQFKINLESYEILYALVNYVKQFHITRYYERIKQYVYKLRGKQKNQSNYVNEFNKKKDKELEDKTKKEKEAQNLLQIYKNILFNNASKKMIDEMENDQQQMDKVNIEQDNHIKQAFSIKLKGTIKTQEKIKEIINKEYYKTNKYAQMLEYEMIYNNSEKKTNQKQ